MRYLSYLEMVSMNWFSLFLLFVACENVEFGI